MMDPAKLQRVSAAFSLLRESIAIVKGLKKVMAAPQQKTVDQTSEESAAIAEADLSRKQR
jgi:hypothetical protein